MRCLKTLVVFVSLTSSAFAGPPPRYFTNPVCRQADPWIFQHDGKYLACFEEGNNAISVRISDRLTVIGPTDIVWHAPVEGLASKEVWAPELHLLHGRWCVYFAASDGQNKDHRAWVIQSAGSDSLGPYTSHGPLYTGDSPDLLSDNRWAIDMTVFELRGQLYAVWSDWRSPTACPISDVPCRLVNPCERLLAKRFLE